MLWPITVPDGRTGRAIATAMASNATTTTMRMARNVNGSANGRPYLAPMKPELHRTMKRPGAIRTVSRSSECSGARMGTCRDCREEVM